LTPAKNVSSETPSREVNRTSAARLGTVLPPSTDDTNARVIGLPSCAWVNPRARRSRRTSKPTARAKDESGPAARCLEIVDIRTEAA
jgi:hypothetical protein